LAQSPPAPAQLKPTGKWVIDYADSMCVLQREYGTAGRLLTFGVRPSLMDQNAIMMIAHSGTGERKFDLPATVFFGDSEGMVTVKFESSLVGGSVRLNNLYIERSVLERAIPTERIAITVPGAVDANLAVPGFAQALSALDECTADLLHGW
jgi:hypothetical protein